MFWSSKTTPAEATPPPPSPSSASDELKEKKQDASVPFISKYMDDISNTAELASFLKTNQPKYDSSKDEPSAASSNSSSSPPPPSSSASSSSSSSSSSSAEAQEPPKHTFNSTTQAGMHALPSGFSIQQRQLIYTASLDNCSDLNLELTNCLLGKTGTWWDRASMCMKQKEEFGNCCKINREVLKELDYGHPRHSEAENQRILDRADEIAQAELKRNKDEKETNKDNKKWW